MSSDYQTLHGCPLPLGQGGGAGFDVGLMLENTAIVIGHHADEPANLIVPVIQNLPGDGTARKFRMIVQEISQRLNILRLIDRLQ